MAWLRVLGVLGVLGTVALVFGAFAGVGSALTSGGLSVVEVASGLGVAVVVAAVVVAIGSGGARTRETTYW